MKGLKTNLAQLHLYAWTLGVLISCNLLDYPEMPESPNDSWSARKLARFHSLYYGIRLLDHGAALMLRKGHPRAWRLSSIWRPKGSWG